MRRKPSSFAWVQKAGPFVQSEELIDRKRVHLDAIRRMNLRQPGQTLHRFLIERI
jgi:hypothetical protein